MFIDVKLTPDFVDSLCWEVSHDYLFVKPYQLDEPYDDPSCLSLANKFVEKYLLLGD